MDNYQGEQFGQRRPPLSVTIKSILERYPDGQIFKEMIQNADDAGAKTVQFFIDSRQHGTRTLVHPDLAQFQGPALIAANDASFSDADWEGIQRLQQSIKAEDPFKVGRFGIGFNSAYHISDVPTIISGERIAYLDPQERIWPGQSGRLFQLANLQGSDALAPFNGIANFRSRGMTSYPKTLFRFPLRTVASDLSENIYNTQKLQMLTNALREEAKYLLLFLRSINKVEVYNISLSGAHSLSFSVQIASENQSDVGGKRSTFMAQLRHAHECQPYSITQLISFTAVFEIKVNDNNYHNNQSGSSVWLVANCVGSSNRIVTAAAKKQHVFPWVGTSLELTDTQAASPPLGGRIYCFLPLPIEASSNLPVNVNGTFSLNDERRTLKWPGRERTNDPMAEWNRLLVTQLLPHCYALLLEQAMKCFQPDQTEQFYSAWPDVIRIRGSEWEGVVRPLLDIIFKKECVWSSVTQKWITLQHATFIPRYTDLKDVVKRVLTICRVKLVNLTECAWNALDYQNLTSTMSLVTPKVVRREMRANPASYTNETASSKLELLKYCLSDKNFADLHGLQLLPLANNTFVAFQSFRISRSSESKYLCSNQYPSHLLPNINHLLVDVKDASLQQILESVASSGNTQLEVLSIQNVAKLLPRCFPSEWAHQQTVSLPSPSFPSDWFQTFWNWVQPHNLSSFANQLVVPLAVQNTQYGFKATRLVPSSNSTVIYINEYCSPNLLNALMKLQVQCTILSHVGYHLWHRQLLSYLNNFNSSGVLTAITNANHYSNTSFSSPEASELQSFLASRMYNNALSFSQQNVLKNLAMFKSVNKQGLFSIVQASNGSWGNKAIKEPPGLSSMDLSTLPSNLVVLSGDNQTALLQQCSSSVTMPNTLLNFVLDITFNMIKSGSFPEAELDHFMEQVLKLFPILKQQDSSIYRWNTPSILVTELSSLPFLKTAQSSHQRKTPQSLFDPSSNELKEIYQGKAVFPIEPFNQKVYLPQLRECSLRVSVTAQEIISILNTVSANPSNVPQRATHVQITRIKAVLSYICSHSSILSQSVTLPTTVTVRYSRYQQLFTQAFHELSNNRSFLPILSSCPEDYPCCLRWKGSDYSSHLVSLSSSVLVCEGRELDTLAPVVGSQMYVVECPSELHSLSDADIPINSVLLHFQHVIENKKNMSSDDLSILVDKIYTFLSKNSERIKTTICPSFDLHSDEWIWIQNQNTFVSPTRVVTEQHDSFEYSLQPHIYQLPYSFLKYSRLFTSFGVHHQLTDSLIISTLEMIKEDESDSVPAQQAWRMVEHILTWLTDGGDSLASIKLKANEQLYVPIESTSERPQLMEVEKVVYTDLDFLKAFHLSTDETITFIHHKVAHLAKSLKVKPLSSHLNLSEDAFGDVGQHEPLVTRLKNILRDYKDGLTIIKELLQNADDAEATELNICYDARTHVTKPEELIFSGMSECHGPALIIHNNAVFTDEDFENITKLAGATKLNKPLKIGKFGVGFCSVYHITDVPSFISRDWLYIFDPTISYLKNEIYDRARPGKKLRFTERLVSHSKQLQPYLNLYGFQQDKPYQGTLFRFPFRTSTSDISGLRYDNSHVDQLVSDVQQAGSKLLLFLKSIKRITFTKLTNGSGEPEMLLDIRKDSLAMVPSVDESSTIHEQSTHIQVQQIEISDKQTEHWLISTHTTPLEFSNETKHAIASVACSMNMTDYPSNITCHSPETISGEVFCFLPLSLKTGLPVHVSSNFAVLNDRTGIHSSDSLQTAGQTEVQWNVQLMKDVIPQAYLSLLLALKKLCQPETLFTEEYKFYQLWPLKELITTHNPWDRLLPSLYTLISNNSLFYSSCTEQWIELDAAKILSTDVLCITTQESTTPQCVVDVVEGLQYPLVRIPPTIVKQFPKYQIEHCTIDEEEFLQIFFENVNDVNMSTRNSVLYALLQSYAVCGTQKQYMNQYVKSKPCVPCTPHGSQLKPCSEVVDPCNEFSKLFEPKDGVFPLDQFHSDDVIHTALVKLGMICNKLPWSMLIERALTVEDLVSAQNSSEIALTRVSLILKCISRNLEQEYFSHNITLPTEASQLKKIAFIPVMEAPKSYPTQLHWRGEGQKLANAEYLMKDKENVYLVGSQVFIACESIPSKGGCGTIPRNVSTALEIRRKPSCVDVVNHLCHIVDTYVPTPPSSSEEKWIEKACDQIYKYLEQEISKHEIEAESDNGDLELLNSIECVWTGKEFIRTHLIATSWTHDGPYLYALPHLLKSKPNLKETLHIQEDFNVKQLLTALKSMYDDFEGRKVGNREIKIIPIIADEVERQLDEFGLQEDQVCYLPDESGCMQNTYNLAFNDAPWCAMDEDWHFVHHKINRRTALRLGVKPVRSKALERYESAIHHFDGVPFGQREELTQRIKNILSEYPCDVTVIKELLQNADDAKATKMYIILDHRKHGTHKLPSSEWKDLQGPALLVWNDKGFSEDDFKGIQKLGLGSKRKESESIGQYGIGFNVVYHLTDCPSFFTNGSTLCILDPHCRYVPGADEIKPGRQYNNLDNKFWDKFWDLKTAYFREGIKGCPEEVQTQGTLFRFPLRHTQALVDKSELTNKEDSRFGISNSPISSWKLEKNLKEWAPKMNEALLFLKHVTELKFFVIQDKSPQFILTHHYKVNLDQSALDSRKMIAEKAGLFTESNNESKLVTYPLSLCEEVPRPEVQQWLIQQGVGDMDKQDQHWKFVPQVKPQHGIAAQIRGQNFKGTVFCFLPLPVQSHLPIHVNGAFILDAARSGLWQSRDPHDPDDKQKWNNRLVEAIASSYANFLVKCQDAYISPHHYENQRDMWSAIDRYYNLFPNWNKKDSHPPEREMKLLSKLVYQKLGEHNARILVSIEKVESGENRMQVSRSVQSASASRNSTHFQAEWLLLKDSDNPSKQAYFWKGSKDTKGMAPILKRIGMKLTAAPMRINEHFSEIGLELPQANPDSVFEYYCKFHHQVSHVSTFPCHIKDSSFLNPNDFLTFTKFIAKEVHHEDHGTYREFPDPGPFELPLLLTADDQLRVFSQESKVIVSKFSLLFKNSLDKFLHPKMIEMKYDPTYFVEPDEQNKQLIHAVIGAELPPTLMKKRVYQASEQIKVQEFLQPLWQCFLIKEVFSTHLESILQQWALIMSTKNQLFLCNTQEEQLLPVIPPFPTSPTSLSSLITFTIDENPQDQQMYEVMKQCGMPILDISVSKPSLCKQFCPQFSQPAKILANLYFLDQQGELLRGNTFENNLKIVFTYFSRIHFGVDKLSLFRVKSLPIFRDIDNKFCKITGETFIWPGYVCEVGRVKWLERTETVFLKHNGLWRQLGDPTLLEIHDISPLILYVKYIFPYFDLFSDDERYEQLLYIRDTPQLFDRALHDSKLEDDESDRKRKGVLFVTALKQLPCLMKDGELRPLYEFCDPEVPIFYTFQESFIFPPSNYSDEEWLTFFRKIGLRQKATQKEFITFCNDVSSGRHKDVMLASRVLLNYLFGESDWHNHYSFLNQVSQIAFVCTEPLKKLSWILPVKASENKIIKGKQTIHLTSLRQAALHKHRRLLWTVMPIVMLPTLCLMTTKEIEEFHRSLGVNTAPSCSQVVQNILNISKSRFANFNLFDKYSEDCRQHKDNDGLFIVMLKNFQYIYHHDPSQQDVALLKSATCIPVNNDGKTYDVTSPVLVTPLQVIASDSHEVKQLMPFVNPLPHELYSVKPRILTLVGVTSDIHLSHVKFALETIHTHIQSQLDFNTIEIVRNLLKKLYELLRHPLSTVSFDDDDLYLPNKERELVHCKKLLHDDKDYYKMNDSEFDFSVVPYSVLSLLVEKFQEIEKLGFQIKQFYQILPENVKPIPFSSACRDTLHPSCVIKDDQSEFAAKLEKNFALTEFGHCAQLILEQNSSRKDECMKFGQALEEFSKSVKVLTISNLKVNVHLVLVSPPTKVGTAKVDFLLRMDETNKSLHLYIDDKANPLSSFNFLESLTQAIVSHVAQNAEIDISCLNEPEKTVEKLLQVSKPEDLRNFLNHLGISAAQLNLSSTLNTDLTPKLGAPIPEEWHHRLQADINNVFRPQEWVGFEERDDYFVFAQVQYQVNPEVQQHESDSDDENIQLPIYRILTHEDDEEGKNVSIIDLYKILRIKQIKKDDGTTELVLYDSESESVKLWDAVKDDKLKDIMREICAELRRIWKIKDKDQRRKAIKAMYLKWHPDKNDSPFATKAFQFLQRQINRLQQGLPLEDPEDDWETAPEPPRDSYWDDLFNVWNYTARRHGNSWHRERTYCHGGGGGRGGGGGLWHGSWWDWESTIRVAPEPAKAEVWLKQAECDLSALRFVLAQADGTQQVSAHVCFLAHQVAEKALKAGMYKRFGLHPTALKTHVLTGHAYALQGPLNPGLQGFASSLESYYLRTRYPNVYTPDSVPSDHYRPSEAKRAENAACQIFEMMKDIIGLG